jgi:hypothetical protein
MATRLAKARALVSLQWIPGLNGIGLVRADGGYGLKVNLESNEQVAKVPDHFDGVPVRVEVVGPIEAYGLSSAQIR